MRAAVWVSGLAASLLAGVAGVPASATAAVTDVYVNNAYTCSDGGSGTTALPFCTIQAGVDAAQPGQTVHVVEPFLNLAEYAGEVHVTKSGTPGSPITIVADVTKDPNPLGVEVNHGGAHAFTVAGAHDVVISGFQSDTTAEAVVVTDSARITVNGNTFTSYQSADEVTPGIRLSGQTSDVTISRNTLKSYKGPGIAVDGGADDTITTNAVTLGFAGGISVTGGTGTAVTSNSVLGNCGSGISVSQGASGTAIENNVATNLAKNCAVAPTAAEIVVAADSADATTARYNEVTNAANQLYNWAGTSYSSVAAFQDATGQGEHDLDAPLHRGRTPGYPLAEGSPTIDSADANARGELDTDLVGYPRVQDPLVPDTGSGTSDRGAYETQNPFAITAAAVTPGSGLAPLPVTASYTVTNPWSSAVTYGIDFGDGSAPVLTTSPGASHTYPSPADRYDVKVTLYLPDGVVEPGPSYTEREVQVDPAAPPAPVLSTGQYDSSNPMVLRADARPVTDGWEIADYTFDFGDGTAAVHDGSGLTDHTYAAPGVYSVQLSEKDRAGRTSAISRQVVVGSTYAPMTAVRLLDTRNGTGARAGKIGPGGALSLPVTGVAGVPANGVTAVVLNVTATNSTDSSFLSAYPDGTARPAASNVNFAAGQTVPNLVTVPVGADGKIVLYNRNGSVDVLADLEGYYTFAANQPSGTTFYAGVTPSRLMDTRATHTTLGPGGQVVLRTPSFPDAAPAAIVLNVTVTGATDDSFLTVYPAGAPRPGASNLNFMQGQTTSNLVVVPAGQGATVFYNRFGHVDVIADVEGYYWLDQNRGGSFVPVTPTRLLDTRNGPPVGAGGTVALPMTGVPPTAAAAVLNTTVTNPSVDGFLTVYPGGVPKPDASNLNFTAGETVAGQVVVPIGADRKIDFSNRFGTVDVLADLFGYFGPPSSLAR